MEGQPSSFRVYSRDLPTDAGHVSIATDYAMRRDEVVRAALDKFKLSDNDFNLYELAIGASDSNSQLVLINNEEYPSLLLEEEKQKGNDKRLFLRKKCQTESLLSFLTDSKSDSPQSLSDVDDLCKLNDLTESTMLSILRDRFQSDMIYTYVGSILIAINPYHFYSIYNPKYSSLYEGRHLGELPPHIFAIADDAYNSMLNDKRDQAVIISGESGAGKTESTKFLLHQLMELSAKFEETSSLDLITLGTGPVLEVCTIVYM